jgi:hypothetical protein
MKHYVVALIVFVSLSVWGQECGISKERLVELKSQGWVYVLDDNCDVFFVLTKSIRQINENTIEFWERVELGNSSKSQTIDWRRQYNFYTKDWDDYSYRLQLNEIRINRKLQRIVHISDYTVNGKTLSNSSYDDDFDYVVPESIGEIEYDFVIKYIRRK